MDRSIVALMLSTLTLGITIGMKIAPADQVRQYCKDNPAECRKLLTPDNHQN